MTAIKAIETQYKGYRFRSRTEARWAVFFDSIGIDWEYEKEGYDLGVAGWYLPDFWLPQTGMWAEVKGRPFTHTEKMKLFTLALGTKSDVIMLDGAPCSRNYWGWAYHEQADMSSINLDDWPRLTDTDYTEQKAQEWQERLNKLPRLGSLAVCDWDIMDSHRYWETEKRFFIYTGANEGEIFNPREPTHGIKCICPTCDRLGVLALVREARWEHGESPE